MFVVLSYEMYSFIWGCSLRCGTYVFLAGLGGAGVACNYHDNFEGSLKMCYFLSL